MPPKGRPKGKKGGKKISCIECGVTEGGFEECPICDKWICDNCEVENHLEQRHPEYMEDLPESGVPIHKESTPFMKQKKPLKKEEESDEDEETITQHLSRLGISKNGKKIKGKKEVEEEEELSEGSDNYVDEEDLEEYTDEEEEEEEHPVAKRGNKRV
jgi:hypothetical protein